MKYYYGYNSQTNDVTFTKVSEEALVINSRFANENINEISEEEALLIPELFIRQHNYKYDGATQGPVLK